MNLDEAYPKEEYPRISIKNTNECVVCGAEYKYRRLYWRDADTPDGLYEVKLRNSHLKCSNILEKMQKLKTELVDLEFELFCKKLNACKY
jgi:hypothetical protein